MTTALQTEITGTWITRQTPGRKLAKLPVTSDLDFRNRYEMVLRHLPLVRALALSTYGKLAGSASFDDLIHAGILGLYSAAEEFNPTTEVSFIGFAKSRIRGAMLACILSRLAGPGLLHPRPEDTTCA
jgi:DNA-directed RNA polymerase specialized sigma subunit